MTAHNEEHGISAFVLQGARHELIAKDFSHGTLLLSLRASHIALIASQKDIIPQMAREQKFVIKPARVTSRNAARRYSNHCLGLEGIQVARGEAQPRGVDRF